ncbi:MAG: hypothetical protein RIQ70_967 [Bacteroidota bacterium]
MAKKFEEYTSEELENLWESHQQNLNLIKIDNVKCEQVKKLYKNKKLNVIPLWHLDKTQIDLKLQRDNLNDEILEDGYEIYNSVNIELLLSKMDANGTIYTGKQLFHRALSKANICKVINHWLEGTKLIPPSLMPLNGKINPVDGKHRLQVAVYFKAKEIPIFVPNIWKEEIEKILEIKLVK